MSGCFPDDLACQIEVSACRVQAKDPLFDSFILEDFSGVVLDCEETLQIIVVHFNYHKYFVCGLNLNFLLNSLYYYLSLQGPRLDVSLRKYS